MAQIFSLWNTKTFKRELAVFIMLFWMLVTYRIFWHLSPEMVNATAAAYGTLSMAVWAFVFAAFGMDSYVKQIQNAPPSPQAPARRPAMRTREYDDVDPRQGVPA